MKTRLLSLMVALFATTALWALSFKYGDLYYDFIGGGNIEVVSGNGQYNKLTSVNIPSSITYEGHNYYVTKIGDKAFYGCKVLTSITIPDGVTSIGFSAFANCVGLTSIIIPEGVTVIAQSTFSGCTSLTSITIPNSVKKIVSYAFSSCTSLTSVVIGYGVGDIGECVFSDCTNLTSIVVNGENPIYDSRDDCNAIIATKSNTLIAGCLATIIPNSVTGIRYRAFYDSPAPTSLTIPNGVSNIGEQAFAYCKGLTSITLPKSLSSIRDETFKSCSDLTSVTMDNGIMSIGKFAFSSCDSLTSIAIPNSVTTIGEYAFAWCSGLTSVTMGNGITYIGDYAFKGCTNLTTIITTGRSVRKGDGILADCTNIDTLIIPNDVKKIDSSFFGQCSSLKYLSLGSNVKSIADYAFYNAQRLRQIMCYAKEAPEAHEKTFYNYKTYVRVPCEMIDDYKIDVVWSLFENLQCMGAENVSTDGTITIIPSDNTVDITWPANGNADTYSILITKEGKEVCTLIFNSNGQLMRIAFAAPARNGAERHAPAAVLTQNGYRFTVTGLDNGTKYAYAIDVKDKAGVSLNNYNGTFTTTINGVPTDVKDIATDNSLNDNALRKVFRDGQVLIQRGDKTYTLTGEEVE